MHQAFKRTRLERHAFGLCGCVRFMRTTCSRPFMCAHLRCAPLHRCWLSVLLYLCLWSCENEPLHEIIFKMHNWLSIWNASIAHFIFIVALRFLFCICIDLFFLSLISFLAFAALKKKRRKNWIALNTFADTICVCVCARARFSRIKVGDSHLLFKFVFHGFAFLIVLHGEFK